MMMLKIVKKEATNRHGMVSITANTDISIAQDYGITETMICKVFHEMYNVYTGTDQIQLVNAWYGYLNPNDCSCSTRLSTEYAWLKSLSVKKPVLISVQNIFMNSSTKTWWITYSILEHNTIFLDF